EQTRPQPGALRENMAREEAAWASPIETLPPPTFEGAGLTLQVLRYGSDTPVADTLVSVGPAKGQAAEGQDLETFLRKHGEAYRTDADGALRLPAAWQGRWIGMRAGDLWGSLLLRIPKFGDMVIGRISTDRALQVTVVDHAGKGLPSVRVALFGSPHGNIEALLHATTDAQGVALLVLANDPALRAQGNLKFWVDTLAPKNDPPERTYPLSEMPQRVLLQVHHPARLTVQLKGLDGEDLHESRAVDLVRAGEDRKPATRDNPSSSLPSKSSADDGRVAFEGLEPGVSMVLRIRFTEGGATEDLFLEPLQPGEDRTVAVQQEVALPELRLRLVDTMQKPLVDAAIDSVLFQPMQEYGSFPRKSSLRTDADGYLHYTLLQGAPEKDGLRFDDRRLKLQHTLVDQGVVLEGEVDLYRDFEDGTQELGEVALLEVPLLAEGIVVDEAGMPLVDVTVRLLAKEQAVLGEGAEQVVHTSTRRKQAEDRRTDAEGRFAFHGVAKEGEYTIQVVPSGWPSKDQAIRVGDRGIRIVLGRGHILAGRVRLPEELQAKGATIAFLFPSELDPDQEAWDTIHTDAYGFFQGGGLEPQSGRIGICIGGGYPRPHLLEIDQVTPWVPGTPGDPRLAEIDLRDASRSYHVRVIDEQGRSIPTAQFVQVRETEGGSSWITTNSLDGSHTFHAPEGPVAITIKAIGFLPQDVSLTEPETDVVLYRAARGTFLVDHVPTFLPPPGRYEVHLGIRRRSLGATSTTIEEVLDPSGQPLEVFIDEKGEAPTIRITLPEGFYEAFRELQQ
ncbi:MAG: carboxypeptidase-like regulatory domain-containing protein, partial [Planctomycetota bacterium]